MRTLESTAFDELDDGGLARRPSLMVYHRDGVDVLPLVEGEPVTIGRSAPSTMTPRSRRLSRQHARFALEGQEVTVEDLDSTNGTFLNGIRLAGRSTLQVGDEVVMGSVSVSLHLLSTVEGEGEQPQSHERFAAMLQGEIVRARIALENLSLLMVRSDAPDARPSRWFSAVKRTLRMEDRTALYAPGTVEILLSGVGPEEALRISGAIAALTPHQLRVGVVTFPESGASADALTSAVRAAVLRADHACPVVLHEEPFIAASEEQDGGPILRDTVMQEVYRTLDRVSPSSIPVLITGETGTGKEVLARTIHERSNRSSGPMRCINCGAIPAALLESVLFGHERGAFTGAERQARGVFEETDGGTLLLDEVGELSPAAQVALLRVLETKRVCRVGSSREFAVDVRVLAATNQDLEKMCEEGRFRWDLLYRLNTMTVLIPPLRERVADIRPLAMRFIRDANRANGREVLGMAPGAMMLLETFSWPGNVRELRNTIERAVVVAHGNVITSDDLPARLRSYVDDALRQAAATVDVSPGTAWPFDGNGTESMDLKARSRDYELALIQGAMRACQGNQTSAAALLRIPRRTLVYKLRVHKESMGDGVPSGLLVDTQDVELDFRERVERFERKMILEALRRANGDRVRAARSLNIQKRTLDQKLDRRR